MDAEMLRKRTSRFALEIISLVSSLPKTSTAKVIGNQLLRSGTSPGANYREACRSRSKIEFISKIGNCITELDESLYWMDLLEKSRTLSGEKLLPLTNEANELLAIFVATSNTAKRSLKN